MQVKPVSLALVNRLIYDKRQYELRARVMALLF